LLCPETTNKTQERILLDRALEQHGGQQPRIQTESPPSPRIERQQPYQNDAYVEQQLCCASASAVTESFDASTVWRREFTAGEIEGEEGGERASESEEKH
jgi:hypothetical protein